MHSNLLVTGAAGFIGSHFIDFLRSNASFSPGKIIVLDSLTYSGKLQNLQQHIDSGFIKFICGDIANQKLVDELVIENKINSIINFAAESHVDRSIEEATSFIRTNVQGTTSLLEAHKKYCKGTFLQISTDEVYGSIDQGSWSESEPVAPNSPYSASKASADLIALTFYKTFGQDIRITRCSNNYGPRQFPEKVIPLFVTNLIDGAKIPLYGEGLNVRDWIHVEDHCRAIYMVFRDGKAGEIYNVGGNHELTNKDLSLQILKNLKLDSSRIQKVEDRKGHDFRYSVNAEKIKQELGFSPQIDFTEGLRSTIQWYCENEHWWRPLKSILKTEK